jgi:hypothetical protein
MPTSRHPKSLCPGWRTNIKLQLILDSSELVAPPGIAAAFRHAASLVGVKLLCLHARLGVALPLRCHCTAIALHCGAIALRLHWLHCHFSKLHSECVAISLETGPMAGGIEA